MTATGLGVLAVVHGAPSLAAVGALRRRCPFAGAGRPGHIALTFDDGPHPVATERVLRLLERYRVHATFFLLGRSVAAAPGLAAKIADAGHEVAVHGFDHRCLLLRRPRATYDDFARATEAIVHSTATIPRWIRPCYGVLTAAALRAARRLGLAPVLWGADGRDWTASATGTSVHRTVTAGLAGGETILLHDSDVASVPGSWRATLDALPAILETCQEDGLRIGPLREHGLLRPGREVPSSDVTT